jgi:proteasome lid subunit RPN8/RPN11
MKHVDIPRTIVNQLLTHAQKNPEREVCGLISSHSGHPARVYPVDNISKDPRRLFEMDPKEQIDALRHMREQGHELFGIYHSHPHSPPTPSAHDLEQVGYPDALYLIISLDTKGVLQMQGCYLQKDGTIESVELSLESETE